MIRGEVRRRSAFLPRKAPRGRCPAASAGEVSKGCIAALAKRVKDPCGPRAAALNPLQTLKMGRVATRLTPSLPSKRLYGGYGGLRGVPNSSPIAHARA